MIDVPQLVRNKAIAVGAHAWLDDLPDLVAALAEEWGLTTGEVFGYGTEALVVAADLDDGTAAVLKVLIPRDGFTAADEITVLELADGDGCVRLLRSDRERGALLLERLGAPMADADLPLSRRHDLLCAAASRLWRPAPDRGLMTGAAKGRALAEYIITSWDDLGRPCSERAVAHAVQCAERRAAAHDDERALLVHGDVHQWNALVAPSGDYRLIDPDGLLAEPELDLGVMMREDPVELMAGDPWDRAHALAARRGGLDVTAIWEWGVAERVSTGLVATRIDLQPVGSEMLAAADLIAASC